MIYPTSNEKKIVVDGIWRCIYASLTIAADHKFDIKPEFGHDSMNRCNCLAFTFDDANRKRLMVPIFSRERIGYDQYRTIVDAFERSIYSGSAFSGEKESTCEKVGCAYFRCCYYDQCLYKSRKNLAGYIPIKYER